MKLLLYCTKGKPYLFPMKENKPFELNSKCSKYGSLNGKIVAECDFAAHNIIHTDITIDDFSYGYYSDGKTVRICKDSCLTTDEIFNYLYNGYVDNGYAIHIKNLHIYDEPRPTKWYGYTDKKGYLCMVEKAPQNMMYCYDEFGNDYILISIHPEWLCKILNGECTIIIKKKVLKDMMEND